MLHKSTKKSFRQKRNLYFVCVHFCRQSSFYFPAHLAVRLPGSLHPPQRVFFLEFLLLPGDPRRPRHPLQLFCPERGRREGGEDEEGADAGDGGGGEGGAALGVGSHGVAMVSITTWDEARKKSVPPTTCRAESIFRCFYSFGFLCS